MSELIGWIAAQAERPWDTGCFSSLQWADQDAQESQNPHPISAKNAEIRLGHPYPADWDIENLPAHQFSRSSSLCSEDEQERTLAEILQEYEEIRNEDELRERRIYRARTVTMLRRYLKYSIETGRLPSLLGKEFFYSKVTAYTMVTFEDRVIFVHDMERSLERLDEFSRQLIARHILQEHDLEETARLLHCTERTVRRLTPFVLDQLSEILLEKGLMERNFPIRENTCQGGFESQFSVSDCEEGKNNF
jgi:hypothetical protein